MHNVIVRNLKEAEEYRNKIFKSKEECRDDFSKLPFREKVEIAFDLHDFAIKFKNSHCSDSRFNKRIAEL